MPIEFGDGVVRIGTDSSTLESDMAGWTTKAGVAATAMGAAITGALGLAVASTVSYGSNLVDVAARTGLTTEATAELTHAFEQTGSSGSALELVMKNIVKGMDDATQKGGGPFKEALDAIGLSAGQLNGLAPDERFEKIAIALSNVQDPTRQAALAMDLFGAKVGVEVIPLIKTGEDGIRSLREEAQALGLSMSTEQAEAAETLGDTWANFGKTLSAVKMELASALIPILQQLLDKVIPIIEKVVAWIREHEKLTGAIVIAVGALGAILTVLGPLLIILPGLVTAFGLVAGVIAAASAPMLIIIGVIVAVGLAIGALAIKAVEHFGSIGGAASALWDGIKHVFQVGVDVVNGTMILLTQGIIAVFRGIGDVFKWFVDMVLAGPIWVIEKLVGAFQWLWSFLSDFVTQGPIQAAINLIGKLASFFGGGGGGGGGGGNNFQSGGVIKSPFAIVGDVAGHGELIAGAQGATVMSNRDTRNLIQNMKVGQGGGANVSISIPGLVVRERADLDYLLDQMSYRLRSISQSRGEVYGT